MDLAPGERRRSAAGVLLGTVCAGLRPRLKAHRGSAANRPPLIRASETPLQSSSRIRCQAAAGYPSPESSAKLVAILRPGARGFFGVRKPWKARRALPPLGFLDSGTAER